MTLDPNDPKLTAYALGELDEPGCREVEAALEGDEAARRAVEEIRRVAGMLTEQLAGEPAPGLTDEQRRAVRTPPREPVRRIRLWVPLAAAAAALLAVGVGIYLATRRPDGGIVIAPKPGPRRQIEDPASEGTDEPEDGPDYYGTPEPKRQSHNGESKKVELKLNLPTPQFIGTKLNIRPDNLPPRPRKGKRPPLMVPRGTKLLSRDKPVTASDTEPVIGELELITDGDKEAMDGSFVEIGPGRQWVQIDLEQRCEVFAIALWHYHVAACVVRDVVVQISDDKDFIENVKTVFNNDHDNSSGLGIGKQYEWIETYEGRLIDASGARGRYVRLYSNGRTGSDMNAYTEVEVFGKPAGAGKDAKGAAPKGGKGAQAGRRHNVRHAVAKVRKRQLCDAKPPAHRATTKPGEKLVELKIELPAPQFGGTKKDLRSGNLPKRLPGPRKAFFAPKGTKNLSAGKTVTSSDDEPIIGELEQVTDGDKEGMEGSWVELGPGRQWVQIDLEAKAKVHAIVVWHSHNEPCVFRDVVVQVANEPDFIQDVKTVFNNDHDNSSGLGVGKEYEWIETRDGKLIDAKGVEARYVRLYSSGSTSSDQNPYTEVEVYGRPADGAAGKEKTAPATGEKDTPAKGDEAALARPKPAPAAKTD